MSIRTIFSLVMVGAMGFVASAASAQPVAEAKNEPIYRVNNTSSLEVCDIVIVPTGESFREVGTALHHKVGEHWRVRPFDNFVWATNPRIDIRVQDCNNHPVGEIRNVASTTSTSELVLYTGKAPTNLTADQIPVPVVAPAPESLVPKPGARDAALERRILRAAQAESKEEGEGTVALVVVLRTNQWDTLRDDATGRVIGRERQVVLGSRHVNNVCYLSHVSYAEDYVGGHFDPSTLALHGVGVISEEVPCRTLELTRQRLAKKK